MVLEPKLPWSISSFCSLGFLYIEGSWAFVDYRTRTTWVYLLKSKTEVFSCFLSFHKRVCTQFNAKINFVESQWHCVHEYPEWHGWKEKKKLKKWWGRDRRGWLNPQTLLPYLGSNTEPKYPNLYLEFMKGEENDELKFDPSLFSLPISNFPCKGERSQSSPPPSPSPSKSTIQAHCYVHHALT